MFLKCVNQYVNCLIVVFRRKSLHLWYFPFLPHQNVMPGFLSRTSLNSGCFNYYWGWNPPFCYTRYRAILSSIPNVEVWYAGCHFWSKLDSDAMNWKVKNILEQKQSKFIKSSFNQFQQELIFVNTIVHANIRT